MFSGFSSSSNDSTSSNSNPNQQFNNQAQSGTYATTSQNTAQYLNQAYSNNNGGSGNVYGSVSPIMVQRIKTEPNHDDPLENTGYKSQYTDPLTSTDYPSNTYGSSYHQPPPPPSSGQSYNNYQGTTSWANTNINNNIGTPYMSSSDNLNGATMQAQQPQGQAQVLTRQGSKNRRRQQQQQHNPTWTRRLRPEKHQWLE